MATVTKPVALDESLNTTDSTPKNIADVLKDKLGDIASAISGGGGGSGGHTIQNASGANMPQEPTMQFTDSHVSDDSTNEKTEIEVIKSVASADYSSETEDGLYLIPDGDGSVIEPASEDYVEVVADGDKTYRQLLNELLEDVDLTKINIYSKIIYANDILIADTIKSSELRFVFNRIYSQVQLIEEIVLSSSSSFLQIYNGSYQDKSTDKPTNGTKITLYYGNKKAVVDLQTTANRCLMGDGRTVENAVVVDVSDKFSASNNKLRISAQKHGKRITLSASGYDGSFSNGTYIIINDSSLYPNVTDGTYLGGGMGIATGTPATFITTDGYKTSNIILIYHSQDIAVNLLQFNVVYDIL